MGYKGKRPKPKSTLTDKVFQSLVRADCTVLQLSARFRTTQSTIRKAVTRVRQEFTDVALVNKQDSKGRVKRFYTLNTTKAQQN